MKRLFVNAGKGYELLLENGLLSSCGEYIQKVSRAKTVCLISDTNVEPLYGKTVTTSLEKAGFAVTQFTYPAGEASKTPATVLRMVEHMAARGMTRRDLVVSLGGGVCGDMAGFAAAIYLRGIDFVQLPTSLLAQVDSSVGGKTAVDLPQGKNLCGAFHQPRLVLIDPNTLETLPARYYSDGLAEAIKMGCIKSKSLFETLETQNAKAVIDEVIFECVALKAEVVARDEKEVGERALLNFGHTVGHAIERLHNFETVSHGEAVGIGMVAVCKAAEKNGKTESGCAERIAAVLKKYQLPTEDSHSLAQIVAAMSSDKKRTGDAINFILIKEIGDGYIQPVENDKIAAFFGV